MRTAALDLEEEEKWGEPAVLGPGTSPGGPMLRFK